jgi:Bacterial low temperature requirement A protein (LtrA)
MTHSFYLFQLNFIVAPTVDVQGIHFRDRPSRRILPSSGQFVTLFRLSLGFQTNVFYFEQMGLIAAYLLCWLYFDQDLSQTYIHALRRHWFSALSANLLHFPFCCGLIIWSASMPFLVHLTAREEPLQGVRWYFSGGLATALLCLALLGWMHKNLDAPGSSWISSDIRLLFRIV